MLVVEPGSLEMPLTGLPERVTLVIVATPRFERPSVALLEIVLFDKVKVPALATPLPAAPAELPVIVEPVIVSVPPLALVTPPPLKLVVLPVRAQLEIV